MDLENRVAFVTGAASGIGLGIVHALVQSGAKVMLCDIEREALDKAVSDLKATNADVAGVIADVSLRHELQAAADETMERFGKVHVLVNNAGVQGCGPYGAWSQNAWDWAFAVNMMSVIYGVDIFMPLLTDHGEGGHIVSTASGAGLITTNSAPYGASKAWLITLSEGLRQDLKPLGVDVSVLCPGMVNTNFGDSTRNLPDRFEGEIKPLAGPGSGNDPEEEAMMRTMMENAMDPMQVGGIVRDGILQNRDYIFTDRSFEGMVDSRYASIKAAFERTV